MTHQNTDARVIELHEKRKAINATLKRTVPRGKRARAKLVAIAATVPLTDKQRARG